MEVASRERAPRLVLNGVDDDYRGLDSGESSYETDKYLQRYRAEQRASLEKTEAGSSYQPVDLKEVMRKAMDEDAPRASTAGSTDTGKSQAPAAIPSSTVNPATVPVRTSSTNAVNGDSSSSPNDSKKPREHRSLASVPERNKSGDEARPKPDERSWMAQRKMQSKTNRDSTGSPPDAGSSTAPARHPSLAQQYNLGGVGADLISGADVSWSAEKENILRGPFDYLESHPGKDIRTQLIGAFNTWLQVPPESLRIITRVVTMLHTSSLLIDDVEDNSNLRRGVPVAHSIFGTAQTINSANYVYFCALQELATLNNSEAVKIYTDELLNLHRGQGMDLFWRDTLTCPSEDDYLEMVGNKTGGLFRLAIKLMCCESPTNTTCNARPNPLGSNPPSRNGKESADSPVDYIPLVNTIGLLFQILDDYRNLSSPTYTTNKGLCEDLTEGKFSFPIIHAIRSDPANLVLINILKQKTQDDEVKRFAVQYMEKCGSFAYTRRVLRGLTRKAVLLVEEVDRGRGKGEGIREVLERLRVERHSRGAQSV